MAEGILGLGSGQAATLNQELIDKLKEAESKAKVAPIETSIEEIGTEKETFGEIETLVTDLLDSVKPFDLFITSGVNVFEEKSASTSGDSVVFNAADVAALNTGITTVNVDTLAQKDVYQSNSFNAASKDALGDIGVLTIQIGSETHNFDTASYSNYDDLAKAIDDTTGMNANVEQVGTDSYRLVIKSAESGLDNALTISGAADEASDVMGFTTGDGSTKNATNHILEAKNLKAFVDGVEYNVATNDLTVDGLKITALKTGESSINVVKDSTNVTTKMQDFVDKFNLLIGKIESEAVSAETALTDTSSMRNIISNIKDKLFGTYGENSDKSVFNYGFELTEDGLLTLNTETFNKAVSDDLDGLKDLFIGTAADGKRGLGTQMKALIDEMTFTGGILDTYEKSIDSRETTLKEDLEKAQEDLDDKYAQLALQFGQYAGIITQFESSFSGLKLMIEQSTAG